MSNPDRPLPGKRYDPRYDADPNVNQVPAGRGPVISGKVADGRQHVAHRASSPGDPPYSPAGYAEGRFDIEVEALTEMAKPNADAGVKAERDFNLYGKAGRRHGLASLFQYKEETLLDTVTTPWGNWAVLFEGKRYKVKRLVVLPGKQTSLQSHLHRQETWVVVHGTAEVINADPRETHDMDDEDLDEAITPFLLEEGAHEHIARCSLHRLGNPGRVPLIVIETQYGSYLSEDDILRVDTSANIPNYYKPLLETEPVDEQE